MPRTSENHRGLTPPPVLKAKTFHSMGTAISLTMPITAGPVDPVAMPSLDSTPEGNPPDDELAAAAAVVERLFNQLDQTFSLYRADSEASRLARGELPLRAASSAMRGGYEEAMQWRLRTEGAFTAERPDGVLDLSGLVKAHAIRESGTSLRALGRPDWCLNAGGDILVSGSPVPGSDEPWDIGIMDPLDRGALLAGYPLGHGRRHAALATSGTAERGDHIWGPSTDGYAFIQVSVAAADITTADVLATSIVAGGQPMLDRATDGWDVAVLAVRANGELLATPGFRRGPSAA
ncbi:FAD:protein FMN transferase [Pseudarthrobacter sp. YS3]|uniref:FAD:protein FMN transferase n=1 Tax=Pseudarthrobacter sp. YS3 TaxID=3453718 RepID=UPI003EEE7410